MLPLLVAVSTLSLATDRVATPISSLPASPPVDTPTEVAAVPEAPASVATVRPLLGARHTADLPDRAALDAHADAEAGLQWIARYADSLVEAERAAMLLALYPSDATTEVCLELMGGPNHAKIRAGAARCLTAQSSDRVVPALVAGLTDTDIRVGVAAAQALAGRPGSVEQLDASLVAALPDEVRTHLQRK